MSSPDQPSSSENGSESAGSPRQACPHCNGFFKDLKAHAYTHAKERPEKCPIKTCEYHIRGFSRKHDRNRHALNHYRGTLVCCFCPGPGTPLEVCFNRLDLYKKHLVETHEVPMKPPNGHRPPGTRSGVEIPGDCNVCRQTFLSPDDLYDHLDDCVLFVLDQEDPTEAINERLLAEIPEIEVTGSPGLAQTDGTGGEDDVNRARRSPNSNSPTESRSRRKRGKYPAAWGYDDNQLSLKKRVTAVFNGSSRLARDEIMLSRELEVRLKLSDGVSYVTDVDVMTMNRAEAIFAGPQEEPPGAMQHYPQQIVNPQYFDDVPPMQPLQPMQEHYLDTTMSDV